MWEIQKGRKREKVNGEQDEKKVTQDKEGPTPDRQPGWIRPRRAGDVGRREALASRDLLLCEIREVIRLV